MAYACHMFMAAGEQVGLVELHNGGAPRSTLSYGHHACMGSRRAGGHAGAPRSTLSSVHHACMGRRRAGGDAGAPQSTRSSGHHACMAAAEPVAMLELREVR